MANKGLQFEHAVMYSAMSRVTNKTAEHQKAFETAAAQYGPIGADIKKVAETIVESYKTGNLNTDQEYFRSYKKMSGGGEEPKTDIMFKAGGKTYKCSMKWGKSFQLTSAGIDKSTEVFSKVLKRVAAECGSSEQNIVALGYLQLILEQINNKCENAKGTVDQPTAKRILSDLKKAGGMNEQLQEVLGSKKVPGVAEVYDCFKYYLTRECMTGEMLFANDPDKAADHMMTEKGVKPINEAAVREVMAVAGVRLAMKGRGKDKITGVRQNALVIRYEV